MHIPEGLLQSPLWELWFAISIPFIAFGIHKLNKLVSEKRELLPLLAVAGAFIFILSSLKMPSLTGASSHPTGTGLAAILFGPAVTAVLGTIVLLYQALFLAHGGLTTLGANVVSMGVIGPLVAYLVYKACMKANVNFYVGVFLAASLADLFTYLITSLQLALAVVFGQPSLEFGELIGSFIKFAGIFALTQVPIAIVEGALTALILKYVIQVKGDVLVELKVISHETIQKLKGVVA